MRLHGARNRIGGVRSRDRQCVANRACLLRDAQQKPGVVVTNSTGIFKCVLGRKPCFYVKSVRNIVAEMRVFGLFRKRVGEAVNDFGVHGFLRITQVGFGQPIEL